MHSPTKTLAATPGRPKRSPGKSSPRPRKPGSRERLLAAATEKFLAEGYINVSVEDIAKTAGVSRMTFYRHFDDKVDISLKLFKQAVDKAKPCFLSIREVNFYNPSSVKAWITDQFELDRDNRSLLKVFGQATAEGTGFTEKAQAMIGDYITELGKSIPAFNLRPNVPGERRRWLEAWLLIYEILDQSNHAALDSGISSDPLVIDILTDKFLAFTEPKSNY